MHDRSSTPPSAAPVSKDSFKSKINPKPDPHDTTISTFQFECDMRRYQAVERLAAVDHDQWCYWSQRIMRDLDEMITAVIEQDKLLLSLDPQYRNSPQHRTTKALIEKHNARDKRWADQQCAYTRLPEEVKEQDRLWAKKAWDVMNK